MQLLQDVFIIENLQVLEEGTKNRTMKIRGTFQRAMEANNNGRVYPTTVLEGQISKLQPLIAERRLCGELDHPQNEIVRLSNASHLVTKLEMKGNEVIGEAEVLKTPAGLTAQALINGGVKIGISSRGMGTLSEDHRGNKVVNEDFKLVTFDLVADPSTRGAYPGLAESTESKFVRETQSKLQKESNFVTMLESKMRKAYQPWVDESSAARKRETRGKPWHVAKKVDKAREARERAARGELPTLKKEAFELVKADGHWHRIAEVINAKVNEVYTQTAPTRADLGKKVRGAVGSTIAPVQNVIAKERADLQHRELLARRASRASRAGRTRKAPTATITPSTPLAPKAGSMEAGGQGVQDTARDAKAAREKGERAVASAEAQKKLKARLAAVKAAQQGSKQSFSTQLRREKTSGRAGSRLERDLTETSYKQIGRLIAEALGWKF